MIVRNDSATPLLWARGVKWCGISSWLDRGYVGYGSRTMFRQRVNTPCQNLPDRVETDRRPSRHPTTCILRNCGCFQQDSPFLSVAPIRPVRPAHDHQPAALFATQRTGFVRSFVRPKRPVALYRTASRRPEFQALPSLRESGRTEPGAVLEAWDSPWPNKPPHNDRAIALLPLV
jgi:hypothetical protein